MADSTLISLADLKASCRVVTADDNGLVTFTKTPVLADGTELGGGGVDISQGIVIGEGATVTCAITDETFVDNIAIGTGAVADQEGGIAIGCSIASDQADVAIGFNATASGGGSTALGVNATASGGSSAALGYWALASGNSSMALGNAACAKGDYSTALGSGATASGGSSTALGVNACAAGDSSTALGSNACACGDCSTALGYYASAMGCASTALGYCASATGLSSTALGGGAYATGASSMALGYRACSFGTNSISIGLAKSEEGGIAISSNNCMDNPDLGSVEGNEILLYSENTCQYIGGNTSTVCGCYGCVSKLKVSKEGVLTVNDSVMAKQSDVSALAKTATRELVASLEEIDTSTNSYSLSDIAGKLNALLKALKQS